MSTLYDSGRILEGDDDVYLSIVLAEAILEEAERKATARKVMLRKDPETTAQWHPYAVRIGKEDSLVFLSTSNHLLQIGVDITRLQIMAMAMDLNGNWKSRNRCMEEPLHINLSYPTIEGIIKLAHAHLLYGRKRP